MSESTSALPSNAVVAAKRRRGLCDPCDVKTSLTSMAKFAALFILLPLLPLLGYFSGEGRVFSNATLDAVWPWFMFYSGVLLAAMAGTAVVIKENAKLAKVKEERSECASCSKPLVQST